MKTFCRSLILILFLPLSLLHAQGEEARPPFIFTVYGGLYFPANVHFKDVYDVNSELIYGFGAALPLGGAMFIAGDLGYVNADAFLNESRDSSIALEERLYHLGLLSKEPVGTRLFLRLIGGINYVTIKQRTAGPASEPLTVEAEKKIGYFAGIGIERVLGDGRASFFGDVEYDYRRAHQKGLEGDFGGLRLVAGAHLFLF